jgi:hypothetical protein
MEPLNNQLGGPIMTVRASVIGVLLLAASACDHGSRPLSSSASERTYTGSASVGDFLSLGLDPATQTLIYSNYSNGDSGTVRYGANADGTYTLNDPSGNLTSGYEVPNYGMLLAAEKAGPNHDSLALITALQTTPITLASLVGRRYNYIQFRTNSGGPEAGSVVLDAQGNLSLSGYSPYAAQGVQGKPKGFTHNSFSASQFQEDPSGMFLKLSDRRGGLDYVFGMAGGVFVVDTANGAVLAFKKAASKNFDPSFAAKYQAVYYEKIGATVDSRNQESGTPDLGHATVTIDTTGQVTVADADGDIMLQAPLTPVADAAYLYGSPGELKDPCYGLFTFRVYHGSQPQDVFATFVNGAVLFSSFAPTSRVGYGYEYLYGVGLK